MPARQESKACTRHYKGIANQVSLDMNIHMQQKLLYYGCSSTRPPITTSLLAVGPLVVQKSQQNTLQNQKRLSPALQVRVKRSNRHVRAWPGRVAHLGRGHT